MNPIDEIDRHLRQAEDAISRAIEGEDHRPTQASSAGPAPLASLLLVVSAQSTTLDDGRWQFAIETAQGVPVLEADDHEPGDLNRLTLLAAVRGLEAIDGSASVTLLSHNRYLIRSLTDSLPRWRRSDFVWDHFGRRVEVQHADLWRRIDHALGIHEVQACLLTARMVSRPNGDSTQWIRTDPADSVPAPAGLSRATAESPAAAPLGDSESRISFTHRKQNVPAPHLSGTNRLRDWVLRSAVDTSHRAQQIAMLDQRLK
ncbi:ribonuclease H family protein [Neorhodopirellula pilleata]|uniref:Ribonuclease HI n=1 Tax=Neorhodopirellula pilleata TaxID=2714738 RepID=A0A5C6AQT3_9BACT|nr:ribonuclease HI [Neorhodopirellula pilleata]TWU01847.1 Ribonuclease HI [Neorhodopirellula pilleata]